MTFTFNPMDAVLLSSDATDATYSDPTGTSALTFGSFSYTGTAPEILISSNDMGGYGYEFSQPSTTSAGYNALLLSTDPAVAPTTSLSSLGTFPISDFNTAFNSSDVSLDNAILSGSNTSFSVQPQAVPEPSSVSIGVLALLAFIYQRFGLRRSV